MLATVIKRDGSKENFDPEKLSRVLSAAGLEPDKIETIQKNLSVWLQSQAKVEVTSIQIRDQVLTELKNVDPYVAGLYQWYQKTKDTSINV